MSWTDERVEKLSKLWAEGLSASQIAAELGGVTRNAVIGKVHRLGLSGRAKSNASTANKQRRKPAASTTRSTGGGGGGASHQRSRNTTTTHAVGNAALKINPEVEAEVQMRTQAAEDVVVPISKKLTLMELTEDTCKWPTGDPTRPGFSFCGHKSKEDKPYCEYHSKSAFQESSDRRRRR